MIHNLHNPLDKLTITQAFGGNPDLYKKFGLDGHNGLDFRAAEGTPVYACMDGHLLCNDSPSGYGTYLKIENEELGLEATYGHLSVYKTFGKTVKKGDLIALSGNTGFSTGPHLHFGLRECTGHGHEKQILNYDNGYKGAIDPLPYLMKGTYLIQLVEGQGGFGVLIDDKLYIDDLTKLQLTFIMRNHGDIKGRCMEFKQATWDKYKKYNLKNEPL